MSCSSTSPGCAPRRTRRRATGVKAINRALEGIAGPDRRASLLRLRRGGAQQADRLRLPAAAGRLRSPGRSRSRRRSRSSTSACCRSWPARRSCSASSISAIRRSRRPRRSPARLRAGLRYVAAERLVAAARLRHEIPAARQRVRQAARARRGRRDRAGGAGRGGLRGAGGCLHAARIGLQRSRHSSAKRQGNRGNRKIGADSASFTPPARWGRGRFAQRTG